ncbi:MAG TPA: hypothetical protein VFS00_07630 [Polyangiaceae bacterium]|nr:hypothetical protein [Polyangiaceae bacterium]
MVTPVRRHAPARAAALAAGLLVSAPPSLAWANSATGLKGLVAIFAPVCWLLGGCALAVSGLLGAAAWWAALRARLDSAGKVFARGFLGVGAAVSFGVGSVAVALGFLLKADDGSAWGAAAVVASLLAVLLTVAFLAAEFVIAGLLYLRVHRRQGGPWALPLAAASFGLAALLALSPFAGLVLFVAAALA